MLGRNSTMGITAIPTNNGTVICMDYIPHSVVKAHLTWQQFCWRLTKLLRHIVDENAVAAIEHHNEHVRADGGKPATEKVCDCVGTESDRDWKKTTDFPVKKK